MLGGMLPAMLLILVIITVVSILFARYAAKTIVKPINSLDLDNPLGNATYEVMRELLELSAQEIAALRQQKTI